MTVRKNSWIRRVIAAGMAIGIVVSTTLPSLAEGVAGDGYDSQITVENSLAGTDSAEKAEAADDQADGMESAETESSQDGTDTAKLSRTGSRQKLRQRLRNRKCSCRWNCWQKGWRQKRESQV